jgi:5S rRNA maturation endonuclease (ribonuclease M5)
MSGIPQSYHGKPLIHAWNYCAMDGAPFGVVGRYQDENGKKDIVPFFKRNGTKWVAGIELSPRHLFGLDMLANHPKDKAIFIVEGEKSAAALQDIGLCAVTSLGGSQAAKLTDWTPLNGYKLVYLLPDNDKPGENYIKDVYVVLSALESPPKVKVLRLADLPESGDIVDWIISWGGSIWNEYEPIPEAMRSDLKEVFEEELQKAEPVPISWTLDTSCSSVFDWAKPGEIETKTPPVQILQAELIPEPFQAWLADVSHRMQTPGDFAAISSIVITGSVIGAGCGIRPKRLDDFEVIPNVWGACIGRPSVVLKTPSMKEPMGLLECLQAEYGEQFERDKKGFEFDNEVNQSVKKSLKADLDKATKKPVIDKTEIEVLRASFMELDEAPEATRRLFKTNETSIQSMTLLQTQNPRGILVFRDELTGLLVKWDREDGADERAYFLEGWNGDGSYTDVKISRGITEAKSICISLLGGIQPDKLKRYLYQAQQGNNDGLIQRLQLAVWPDEPEVWQLIDTKPIKVEKQRAFNILKVLAEMDFRQYGAIQSEYDERPYFRFDDAGQEVFNQWLTELQTIKIKREENPLMVEHFGKFRSLMPSLALIFHCIDIADGKARGNVSAQAARLAVNWCDYLESHARRIYAMAESPEHEAAVRLASKIRAKALPCPFTSKIVYDKGWHGLKDKLEVEAACNILIDENWLIMTRKPASGNRGRPPLPEYQINPDLL